MAFINAADENTTVTGWYLGLIAFGISFPVAVLISAILVNFRSSISGTEFEKQLSKAKGMRIGTVSAIVGFLGAGEAVAFGTGLGQVIFFIAWIGVVVGIAVHFHEMVTNRSA